MARGRGHQGDEKPIGIKDVAAAAGVSITTVSHALNGKGRLPPATREHVRAVARRLGYKANSTARHFAGGRTGLIAMAFSPELAETLAVADFAFYAQFTLAAANVCLESGFAPIFAGGAKPSRWLDARPDGVLGIDPVIADPLWSQLDEIGMPYVTVGRRLDREHGAWVDNDHRLGALRTFEHLRDRGAERIAVIGTGLTTAIESDIVSAYEEWCAEQGHAPLYLAAERNLTEVGGFDAMSQLLSVSRPPDAVYGTVDRLALGAVLAARANGVTVPDQLMVVACSDSEATRWSTPSLTALDLKPTQMARAGIELLTGMIDGSITQPSPRIIPIDLVERDSTNRPVVKRRPRKRGRGARAKRAANA